jgi:predicted metal-dependent enzyme (double-stranded beta helix superfamily)
MGKGPTDRVSSRRQVLLTAALALTPSAAMPQSSGKDASGTPSRANRFSRERFVEDCVNASRESDSQSAVHDVLARAVFDHRAALSELGEPKQAGMDVLHRSHTLTIFAAKWAPQMCLVPHDHRMWTLIGIYTGREDNIFWQKAKDRIEATGASVLFPGDVARLPADVIHSVTNPLSRFTGGLHIYGGDFFATRRSQWDAETLAEEPSDGAVIRAFFDRENARLERCGDI